jgi:hypothetical protein
VALDRGAVLAKNDAGGLRRRLVQVLFTPPQKIRTLLRLRLNRGRFGGTVARRRTTPP